MRKTTTRLADGREIIYFDEGSALRRPVVDARELDKLSTSSEIRFDPTLNEWIAIASQRQSRTHLPPREECPLCPSIADRHTEIPSESYDVVVFENRFPSFTTPTWDAAPLPDPDNPLVVQRPGAGRCEVMCFTPQHDTSFAQLSPSRVRTIMEAWSDRTSELSALPYVEQVFCFENRGAEIGVTLDHPHGQIYAYPFVTPRTERMLDSARRHHVRTSRNLFVDLLAAEQRSGTRVVAQTEHWTAFVPAAARWPIELHLYPNRQVPDLMALTGPERDDFSEIYLDMLGRLDRLFDQPLPYISAWHQAPVRSGRDLAYLHLQLISIRRDANKLKYLAGSESIMGVFINDVLPEDAAERLRRVA
jgi:UDPglucose--hexose-1-phosphate uridylyltransferase